MAYVDDIPKKEFAKLAKEFNGETLEAVRNLEALLDAIETDLVTASRDMTDIIATVRRNYPSTSEIFEAFIIDICSGTTALLLLLRFIMIEHGLEITHEDAVRSVQGKLDADEKMWGSRNVRH